MKCVAVIFLMLFTWSKHVVANTTEWTIGTVVLNNDQVVNAEISIAAKHDLVLIKHDDRVDVLAAHRIKAIYYYDKNQDLNRKFISVATNNFHHQQWRLYEVVLGGDIAVVRKMKTIASKAESDKDDFDYFIYSHNEMVSLKRFRTLIYPELVASQGELLTAYVKANRLNPNNGANAIAIVERFNKLVDAAGADAHYVALSL